MTGKWLVGRPFRPSIPLCRGSIPREVPPSIIAALRFGTASAQDAGRRPLLRAFLEGPAERFLEGRQVCGEAAGRHQLGELASLGPAKRKGRPPAERPLQ